MKLIRANDLSCGTHFFRFVTNHASPSISLLAKTNPAARYPCDSWASYLAVL